MVRLSESQLIRLIQESANVQELDERVTHQYGSDHIPEARLRAVELCGAEWVFGLKLRSRISFFRGWRVLWSPRSTVLLLFAALAAIAVLNPPYVATIQGITYHMGFHSLFSEATASNVGGINTSLLGVELASIAGIGGVLYLLAGRIEDSRG